MAGVLVIIAAVLAPVSVLATWASGQINDTDRYLETVGPLANDPDVQDAIAARVEQVIYSYLDIEAATKALVDAISPQGLPPPVSLTLQAAVGPLATGIQNFVSDKVLEFVQSDAFEDAWIEANRQAHSQLVKALTGEGDAVKIEDGQVTIGLATIIDAVKVQLIDAGFAIADRIPEVTRPSRSCSPTTSARCRTYWAHRRPLHLAPVIGLLLLAVAIAIARDRRRVVFAAGIAIAASMLLLGAALNAIRPFYLDALPASSTRPRRGSSTTRSSRSSGSPCGASWSWGWRWPSVPGSARPGARGPPPAPASRARSMPPAVGAAASGWTPVGSGVFLRQYRAAVRDRRPGRCRALVPLDRPPDRQRCALVRDRRRRHTAGHRAPGGAPG